MTLRHALLVTLLVGCGEAVAPAALDGGGGVDCATGWRPASGGCEPILPEGDCPAGTMPVIGEATCRPVGLPADCWAGWLPDGEGGCEPILPGQDCPDGTMAIIGEAECQPIGDCGSPSPDPDAVFVDASYAGPDPPDGSASRPFTTLQEGVDAAPSGGQVIVAPGRYVEDVTIATWLAVRGRCAAQVTIEGTGPTSAAVTVEGTGDVELKGLAVTGPGRGIWAKQEGSLSIEEVIVRECPWSGLFAEDGTVIVRRSRFVGNSLGIAFSYTNAFVEDVEVFNSRPYGSGTFGHGILALGSTVQLQHSLLSRNRDLGLLVEGSEAMLEEVIVRDTLEYVDGSWGRGIHIQPDRSTFIPSSVLMMRSLASSNREVGVAVFGSFARLEEVTVRDTLGRGIENGPFRGLESVVFVFRSLVRGNSDTGVGLWGSSATIEESIVSDTLPESTSGGYGHGVQATFNAPTGQPSNLDLRRTLVSGNRTAGVFLWGSGGTLKDVVVRGTRARTDGRFGDAVVVTHGLPDDPPSLDGLIVEDNARAGVLFDDASGSLSSSLVRRNVFSVALEAGANPEIGPDNLFVANERNDVARDLNVDVAHPPTDPLGP